MRFFFVYVKKKQYLCGRKGRMKRIAYIVAVLLVSILLVSGMLIGALMSDRVETAAVRLVAEEFSRVLGTKANIGAMEYRFPARVALKDVYIEDQQHDTLLYAGELYVHFRPLALRDNEIRFSHVRIKDVAANIYRLPDSTWNYAFLLPPQEKKKESSPLKSLVSVRDIQLDNIRVRYEDYEAHLKHAKMDLHHLSEESLDAQITEMVAVVRPAEPSLKGRKDFEINSLQAHLILNDTVLQMPTLTARLPQSSIDLSGVEVRFPQGDTLYLSRSAHDILFKLQLHEAQLVPSDLALFVPRVAQLNKQVALRGELGGTLDSLFFNDIAVHYDGQTVLEGNVSALGLPNLENPYLMANLTELQTNAARMQDFLSRLYGRPIQLPKELHRLGVIHYRGLAEGRLHNLTLHGAFRTALGTITTDGTFNADSLFRHMDYDAQVVGRKFQLGRMIGHAPLRSVTLDVQSKGEIIAGDSVKKPVIRGDIKAHVRKLTYNDYTYNDLHFDGRYEPGRYAGKSRIDDPHLQARFDGVVDVRDVNPEINFNLRCNHFDAEPLGLKGLGGTLRTRFAVAVNMKGSEADRVSGSMILDSLFIATKYDSIQMNQLTLLASGEVGHSKAFTLRSDYLTAQLDGIFRYKDIVPAFQAMMHHYLPSAIEAPEKAWSPVSFTLRADGYRLRDIQRLYTAPITLSDHPTLMAQVRLEQDEEPSVNARFFAPGVRAGGTPVHDLTLTLNTVDTLRHTGAVGSGLAMSVSAEAMQMQTMLSAMAFHDTLLTHLTLRQQALIDEMLPEGWRELSPRELQRALSSDLTFRERQHALLTAQRAGTYGGDLKLVTRFSRYNKKPLIDFHMMPGTLLLRDSLYTLSESRITYCAADKNVQVDHFNFEGGGQHLRVHGIASPLPTDTLEVDLQKIDASYVVPFILPVQTIMFNGLLSGRANITSVLKKPQIDTRIHVDSMGLNNCYFGDAEVKLQITDSLAFHADVYRPDRKVVDLDGKALFDGSGVWELDMDADSVPLEFINHWTVSVLQDLQGNATGHVVVGGRKGLVYVLLNAAAQDASFGLPWTGARYAIKEDTIKMDTTSILFPDVHLTDVEGNSVTVDGGIYHDQFKDFVLDLHVLANNALVFDKEQKGEMLQGHVYANGKVDVTGSEDDLKVIADAVTTRNSRFRLSIDNVSTASASNFIHFVEHKEEQNDTVGETDLDNIDNDLTLVNTPRVLSTRRGRCLLQLGIEVNPQLLFQLVLGERNGDMIQARGSGALKLTYDTETGDTRLLGTYDIERGTLSYTIANVIRKEFTIGEGSTIVFSGNPSNPELNVTAKYRVTANLKDLFGDEMDQISTSRTSIPVLTCLHLSGLLNNPTLSFSLEFPLSDQSIQQQVRQVINTDEMLMRQVIYLLVFGRFFTPDYMSNSQYASLNSTYSLLSSTVTSQINAWLSRLTNMLTLGVAIRSNGEGATASQEYEAQFQLQPLDRLIINGNFGYRYNDISNQPFFGDLDVEVLLTEDGQWRLKGYTHTVDKYSLRQAATIEGVGFMWKKDFNWPSRKKKAKKDSTDVNAGSAKP